MKKLLIISAVLFSFAGCKPDFNPNDDWEAIDVVYGALDPDARQQYFEIGRGYQNNDGNALDLAKLNDSIYHSDSMIVELIEKDNGGKEKYVALLQRALFDNREEGDFVNPEHYLYVLDSLDYKVKDFTNYEIRVTNSVTGKTSYSEIESRGYFHFDSSTISQGFVNLSLFKADQIVDDKFTLKNNGNEDVVYKMELHFHYVTRDEDNNNIAFDTLIFTVNKRKDSSPFRTDFVVNGESFINTILNEVPPVSNPKHTRANTSNMFVVVAYGPEMREYLEAEDNFNAISQTKPFYTNVYDKETGVQQAGLFTSRKEIRQFVSLSNATLKYISEVKPELGFPQ